MVMGKIQRPLIQQPKQLSPAGQAQLCPGQTQLAPEKLPRQMPSSGTAS